MMNDRLRSVSIWGDAHPTLGEVAVTPLGRDLAAGLSCGRFPKPRAPLDPNEDAVLAAAANGRVVLAVADGHNGFDAAEAALSAVQERLPLLLWETDDVPADLHHTAEAAGHAVRTALAEVEDRRSASRTALSVVVIARGWLYTVCFGDTSVVKLPPRGRPRLVAEATPFLGREPAHREVIGVALHTRDRVVVVTDGYTDALGPGWLDHLAADGAAEDDAAQAVRLMLDAALAAGAADNVAVALWAG